MDIKYIKELNHIDTKGPLRPLLISLLGRGCNRCSAEGEDIHHKRYGLDVSLKDLEYLCWPCHKKETWG